MAKNRQLNPAFDDDVFRESNGLGNPKTFIDHVNDITKPEAPTPHKEILSRLIEKIEVVDFREQAELPEGENLKNSHLQVLVIEEILRLAAKYRWGICKNHDFFYVYNGAFWSLIDSNELKSFLGEAAERMGVDKFKARYFNFRDQLFKQFLATAYFPRPEQSKDVVLINLKNGTFEITPKGTKLKQFDRNDFLTYQLPFNHDPRAKAPIFYNYLNRVLPDKERQQILSEYLGYVFIRNGTIKEEKVLFLYGGGSNGKSVFHEVVKALLGKENTSQFSLQDLTNDNGYYRAMIANKLVNYASEITGKLQSATFKQLASCETVSARLPYGNPMQINDYARLIFNVNELPKEVEQTNAFFQRFLIIPFDVEIPDPEQDKQLHTKIIESELSGVFNWVLSGLDRLLKQKRFSNCEASVKSLEKYKVESDSVKMFIDEENFISSTINTKPLKEFYQEYRNYCMDNGYRQCAMRTFSDRLRNMRFVIEKKNYGRIIYIEK